MPERQRDEGDPGTTGEMARRRRPDGENPNESHRENAHLLAVSATIARGDPRRHRFDAMGPHIRFG
jgi:hypothetical protein